MQTLYAQKQRDKILQQVRGIQGEASVFQAYVETAGKGAKVRCLRTFSQQYWRMEMHCLSKIIAQRSIQSMAGAKEKQTQPRRSATLQRVFGENERGRETARPKKCHAAYPQTVKS